MEKYTIGLDFGTQSGRALLVRIRDGYEVAVSVLPYAHGVMTDSLPSGKALPPDFALQHPGDYIEVLEHILTDVIKKAGVSPEQILGIGVATTSSTILPVLADGTPLCLVADFADDPHSWIKLWKHHGAQQEALELNSFLQRVSPNLARQFGTSSAERMLPKILEVKRHSPRVYDSAYTFVELADWLVWYLTGKLQRSAPIAGYKAMWRADSGYLEQELLDLLGDGYAQIVREKLPGSVIPLGRAGNISKSISDKLGLSTETVVAAGYIDAHAAVLGSGVVQPGTLVMVMGTSSCHMLLSEKLESPEGISGVVRDGIAPGFYAYESGQSSVGDQFSWFIKHATPKSYYATAESLNMDIYEYLEKLANELEMGRTGLLALDWWNGNRSVLNDASLTGVMLGLSTQTKPEEIFLALLESTAFGARQILESFESCNLKVDKLCACGGLPKKNGLLVQIYANVMNRSIDVAESDYASALGMAMLASVAAGEGAGGYGDIFQATSQMTPRVSQTYTPQPTHFQVYETLYQEYQTLHDYFGRGTNRVMERLGRLRTSTSSCSRSLD